MTSLPYNNTQGYAGTDTSKERAERDVRDGTANERQRWVIARLGLKGYTGITVAELREDTGWHHGVASSVLTALHIDQKIVRLVEKRGRCKVYVRPEYVDFREESPYKPNSSHKEEVDQLKARIEALAQKWEDDIQRYETSLSIGALPTVAFETRITNTMGHLSDLRRVLHNGTDVRNA